VLRLSACGAGIAGDLRQGAAQQAVAVPFDDLEAALQVGRVPARGHRTEDQCSARCAAQATAELLPAAQCFGFAVDQAEVAEDQQRRRRRRNLPVLRRAVQGLAYQYLRARFAMENSPLEPEPAVAPFEGAVERAEVAVKGGGRPTVVGEQRDARAPAVALDHRYRTQHLAAR
jgi:hypothetical protein